MVALTMKRVAKWSLIIATSLAAIAAGTFYIYLKTLPTRPPQTVSAKDLNNRQPAQTFQCTSQQQFQYAYDVNVTVESQLNNRVIYQSRLHFKTQLSQANGDRVKGVASDITVDEGQGVETLKDIYFLSRIEAADPYTVFSAYNGLGLAEKHPMSIISQLLKALSVGKEGETYRFAYDSLQRRYRYHGQGGTIERAVYPPTADLQQLTQSFDDYKSNWKAELDRSCVPASVFSEESETITAAGYGGYVKFRVEAKKIPDYRDLNQLAFNDDLNAGNHWEVKSVRTTEFENPVANRDQMWEIFNGFADSKNTAQLAKAAEYMIDHVPALELSGILSGDNIADTTKRDLIFGLGLTSRDDAEAYMLDALTTLPMATDNDGDLQKVRLMVAVSGNDKLTEAAFDTFSGLVKNPAVSDNVHSNALINMGTVVRQLDSKGKATDGLTQSLAKVVAAELEHNNNAASAIMAAGNAGLSGVGQEILAKLSSAKVKERYASGMVLSRDSTYYDALIQHIGTERSNLVTNAIVSNLDPEALSSQQIAALKNIAATADKDKADLIAGLWNK